MKEWINTAPGTNELTLLGGNSMLVIKNVVGNKMLMLLEEWINAAPGMN